MDEFQLIRQFFNRRPKDSNVRVGVGDDGAVLIPQPGLDLVAVIDTLVAGVHFPTDLAPEAVGYRSVAVNLSDVAAMGARPRWMTLALTLDHADEAWLRGFARGLFDAADEHGVSLVGGDTTRGNGKVISIQVSGDVAPGKALCRSGAAPGDQLFVSGTIGDAAAGLEILGTADASSNRHDYLINRFNRPTARVQLGQALASLASAAIDVSDGLYSDIAKLIDSSSASAVIEASSIPLSAELRSFRGDDAALRFALGGGDDYELCFAAAPENKAVLGALADTLDVKISCIGEVGTGHGLTCTQNGRTMDYSNDGYRHF